MDSSDIAITKPRLLTIPTPGTLNMGSCELVGVSLAGCRTSLYIPELKICFDAGFPFPFQLSADKFFITHGHLDHSAAIPYIISQKNLNNQKIPTFYMPEELVEPLSQILQIWQKIELHEYHFDFVPFSPKASIEINKNFSVKALKAHHRVPARAYTLIQTKKSLKPEYENQSKETLVNLKSKGIIMNEKNKKEECQTKNEIENNLESNIKNNFEYYQIQPIEKLKEI